MFWIIAFSAWKLQPLSNEPKAAADASMHPSNPTETFCSASNQTSFESCRRKSSPQWVKKHLSTNGSERRFIEDAVAISKYPLLEIGFAPTNLHHSLRPRRITCPRPNTRRCQPATNCTSWPKARSPSWWFAKSSSPLNQNPGKWRCSVSWVLVIVD